MYRPTLEETKKLADQYKVIPLSREIYADVKTPIEVLKIIKTVSRHCYMLESLENAEKWGRYTFLGYDPKLELTCTNGVVNLNAGTKITIETSRPGEYIKQIIEENRSPKFEYLPTFTGGLVGYFSYDYIKYSEPSLNLDAQDQERFQDVDLMLFDKVIAFDHLKQKIILIVNIKTQNLETEYNKGIMELEHMVKLIRSETPQESLPARIRSEFRSLFNKEEYCYMVSKAKQYIKEGDIFQVVLSNRLEADFEGSLLNAYRILRTTNPSPYMFYFSSDDMEIAGASPETDRKSVV
jgi:anthranilate synthase component 1